MTARSRGWRAGCLVLGGRDHRARTGPELVPVAGIEARLGEAGAGGLGEADRAAARR